MKKLVFISVFAALLGSSVLQAETIHRECQLNEESIRFEAGRYLEFLTVGDRETFLAKITRILQSKNFVVANNATKVVNLRLNESGRIQRIFFVNLIRFFGEIYFINQDDVKTFDQGFGFEFNKDRNRLPYSRVDFELGDISHAKDYQGLVEHNNNIVRENVLKLFELLPFCEPEE